MPRHVAAPLSARGAWDYFAYDRVRLAEGSRASRVRRPVQGNHFGPDTHSDVQESRIASDESVSCRDEACGLA